MCFAAQGLPIAPPARGMKELRSSGGLLRAQPRQGGTHAGANARRRLRVIWNRLRLPLRLDMNLTEETLLVRLGPEGPENSEKQCLLSIPWWRRQCRTSHIDN